MKKLNISQVDAVFADGSYPIELLFFYGRKIKTARIRSALKRVSTDFWPLFGEYSAGQIHFDRYTENDFFDEQVLDKPFETTASTQTLFEKFGSMHPPAIKKLFHLQQFFTLIYK